MLRHRKRLGSSVPVRLLYSSRSWEDVIYSAELSVPAEQAPLAYACGPTNFVETVAAGLIGLGYPPGRIRTERFGATGSEAGS